ncbi:MAG: GIY-YIG nuclease family protein [Cyanobacteria bacterium P01_C01_bin.73]
MTTQTSPALAELSPFPYITEQGEIPSQVKGKVGIYAIFDAAQTLQYVGYSRDIYLSLKQHLVRRPDQCHWLKVQTVERPSRTLLEGIRDAWIAENGALPPGNGPDIGGWTQPIDAKQTLSTSEQDELSQLDDRARIKFLKKIARRAEAACIETLKQRNISMTLRFNPKLKESGLLDLK